MEEKKKKPFNKFDLIFFSLSAIIILIISLRLHELNFINTIGTLLLVATAPFLYKFIEKRYGEEKKIEEKLFTIDSLTEKELAGKIASIYTGRGFALSYYTSEERGIRFLCQRKGVRNGDDFLEKGLVAVIQTPESVHYHEFLKFREEMKEKGASQGMMVTNGRFSPEIIDEAKELKIALWGRPELREKFQL